MNRPVLETLTGFASGNENKSHGKDNYLRRGVFGLHHRPKGEGGMHRNWQKEVLGPVYTVPELI